MEGISNEPWVALLTVRVSRPFQNLVSAGFRSPQHTNFETGAAFSGATVMQFDSHLKGRAATTPESQRSGGIAASETIATANGNP